jgi:predicted CoA-binding protein
MKSKIIQDILEKFKTIAIVGLSSNPTKDSYMVAEYLKSRNYHVIPVNPFADEILGKKSYKSLLDLPEDLKKKVEIVNIFRPAHEVPPIVNQAIHLRTKHEKPRVIWMQLGIVNEKAEKCATEAGFTVVMDKCIKNEHLRCSKTF